MISIYKIFNQKIEQIDKYEKDCWIHVVDPTDQEMEDLVIKYYIPPEFIIDSLDIDERSRIEKENEFTMIITRVPRKSLNENNIPYTTSAMGIIYNNDFIMTMCHEDFEAISYFSKHKGKIKNFSTKNKVKFIIELLKRIVYLFNLYLKEISRKSIDIEKDLHKSMDNKKLIKLQELDRSLVYFNTSLKSNDMAFERQLKNKTIIINESEEEKFQDIMLESKQAVEMAKIYEDIITKMITSFSSLISNNLNKVVKLLTAITIILMIPTYFVSLYGMNVKLPFQESKLAFEIVMLISFLITGFAVFLFWKRKWF